MAKAETGWMELDDGWTDPVLRPLLALPIHRAPGRRTPLYSSCSSQLQLQPAPYLKAASKNSPPELLLPEHLALSDLDSCILSLRNRSPPIPHCPPSRPIPSHPVEAAAIAAEARGCPCLSPAHRISRPARALKQAPRRPRPRRRIEPVVSHQHRPPPAALQPPPTRPTSATCWGCLCRCRCLCRYRCRCRSRSR